MKRLVGGDFLLNLAVIQLAVTSTLTNITEAEVISQLTNLKNFISNPSMIKPIWVKLRNSDGKLVVARGSLSVIDADEFELDVILNGYTLKIHIKFTQVLNENDEPIDDWYIATNDAKYLFTTNNFTTFKVADVKNIDGEILSQLKCGDVVIKEDASGEHSYIVTFKSETGICLTYTDASVVETQSYDKDDNEWVYNSEDKGTLPEFAQSGTIVDALGLDSNGKLVKGAISGGTKLYKHKIFVATSNYSKTFTGILVNDSATQITTLSSFKDALSSNKSLYFNLENIASGGSYGPTAPSAYNYILKRDILFGSGTYANKLYLFEEKITNDNGLAFESSATELTYISDSVTEL